MLLAVLVISTGILAIALASFFPLPPSTSAPAQEAFRRFGIPMIIGLSITLIIFAFLAVIAVGRAVSANRIDGTTPLGLTAAAFLAPAAALDSPLRSVLGSRQWLNTPPLRAQDLRGKVVLVNFWTYSCINSLRALPYVRTWAERYKDQGLVVIGVHTPEFGFEKDIANVRRATTSLGVSYPVVLDSDYQIWRAFGNQAWPAFYFLGPDGRVRRQVLGEGDYEKSERLIQTLLSHADGAPISTKVEAITGNGPQAAPDLPDLRSEETYIGFAQSKNFMSSGRFRANAPSLYGFAPSLGLNHWSMSGVWSVGSEFASLSGALGAIEYRFHARDLHLVLAPPVQGHPVHFRVTIDGAAPGADHGSDTNAEGWGTVLDPRMYQMIRQRRLVADRTFKIEFFDAGVRAYVFTFG